MNLKLVIAAAALALMPAVALAQPAPKGPPPGAQKAPPVPSKAEIQKVVQSISVDPAKVQTYCSIQKLGQQMDQAAQKKDQKKMQNLEQQADSLAQKLGPDYVKVMDGLEEVDPESKAGKDLISLFEPLDKQCK
jgi:hypothetical protein